MSFQTNSHFVMKIALEETNLNFNEYLQKNSIACYIELDGRIVDIFDILNDKFNCYLYMNQKSEISFLFKNIKNKQNCFNNLTIFCNDLLAEFEYKDIINKWYKKYYFFLIFTC